jgi:hypothetical protein
MITGNMRQLKVSSQPQDQQHSDETDELRAAITAESNRKDVQHLDSAPEDAAAMNFPRHILSGKYRPFNPPPAPVPENTPESLAAGTEAAATSQETHKIYTAVVTISESTDENGAVTFYTSSSPLVAESPVAESLATPAPTSYRNRMRARREYNRMQKFELTEVDGMFAISVKRQRKLKMKKHKYKKLMRRTRNLRRRLDRN